MDQDGIIEILIEASGTGNGGAGDWQGRILKYRDHSLEETQMLPKGEIEIPAQVMKKPGENAHIVATVEFVITWDEKGNRQIAEWRVM